MASIAYDDIFSQFLGSIDDYDLAQLKIDDAYEMMTEYLHKSLADPFIRKLFSSSSLDDSIQMFTYAMNFVVGDEEDNEFVINVLSKSMIVQWLAPLVRSKLNVSQMFTAKEQKFYSQAQHLSELRGLLKDTTLDLRKMVRSRAYSYPSFVEE